MKKRVNFNVSFVSHIEMHRGGDLGGGEGGFTVSQWGGGFLGNNLHVVVDLASYFKNLLVSSRC